MGMSEHYVIVAEQDWNLRNVLRQYLDSHGFRALVTPIAGEAEDFARHVPADLVLLDTELPGYSSYEACARIRHTPGYEGVPIVLMNTVSSTRRHLAAQRAGASAILLKPFSMNDLAHEIDRFLGDPDMSQPPSRGGTETPPGYARAPVKVWEPAASLAWQFGEDSDLSSGRRTLEMLRSAPRRR